MNKPRWTSRLHPMQIVLGLIIWSLWFATIYGAHGVACAVSPPDPAQGIFNWLNLSFAVGTLMVAAVLLWLAHRAWKLGQPPHELDERQLFVTRVAAGIHLIAALSTLFIGLQLAFFPPCV
ncbi:MULTISPECIES: hypothetical protein [Pseudomonadaceae]|uniref:Uncharacterized protein n=1 Tax=Pseudomonas saudiphocaensis TaxID=1499686 RepID=A0A078LRF1_9PSED|nr:MULTISPECIES: hypothetical protein [Pseudomonadaceae]MCF6783138.1 hypothetical protein [Stutzerimonas stutzeri]MCF6806086.1 hypothetical protein [Stutzerimonas stutzeri]CDZ93875.1 hypothetical protein BN1079_01180 [Pseudomonas saudiphocaensis]